MTLFTCIVYWTNIFTRQVTASKCYLVSWGYFAWWTSPWCHRPNTAFEVGKHQLIDACLKSCHSEHGRKTDCHNTSNTENWCFFFISKPVNWKLLDDKAFKYGVFFNTCAEITNDFDLKNIVNKWKNSKRCKINIFGSLWSLAVNEKFYNSALCGVLIKRVPQIIPWLLNWIRTWTEDLARGSSFNWKDGILASHLRMSQLCAEEILCFLKDREKQIVIMH